MNPSTQIAHAIGLLKMASYNMKQLGVAPPATAELDAFANDLQSALDELPETIMANDTTHCRDCRNYRTEGDGYRDPVVRECVAETHADCPIVLACGFGADDLPAYLKRQAE